MCSRPLKALAILCTVFTLSACHIGYVTRAAYTQSKIIFKSEKINTLLKENPSSLSDEERRKLELVKESREFAKSEIGLKPGKSFTTYTKIDQSELAWIVMGVKKDSFEIKTWWFPIVGSVPYLGFFEKKDAEKKARELEADGYETSVRPTDAFSTLGWFNDPVLSTTLSRPENVIVSTVIHESVHSTIWIPGNVPYNESLANFIGLYGAKEFLIEKIRDSTKSEAEKRKIIRQVQQWVDTEMRASEIIYDLYKKLNNVYQSEGFTTEEKLERKAFLYEMARKKLLAISPKTKLLSSPNNAELVQLVIYMQDLDRFKKLFEQAKGNWSLFLTEVKEPSVEPLP